MVQVLLQAPDGVREVQRPNTADLELCSAIELINIDTMGLPFGRMGHSGCMTSSLKQKHEYEVQSVSNCKLRVDSSLLPAVSITLQ